MAINSNHRYNVSYKSHCNNCSNFEAVFTNGICKICNSGIAPQKKVVLESPLAGNFLENKRYALWCSYDLYLRGEAVFASHLLFTQFLDDKRPEHRSFGIESGFLWASDVGLVAFYMDRGLSPGMEKAMIFWKNKSVDIVARYLPQDLMNLCIQGFCPNNTFE